MTTSGYGRPSATTGALRLHLNENTAGCSPRVVEALRALGPHDVSFYPDYDAVIRRCAAHLGVAPDEVLLTNGLDEGILAAAVVWLRDPGVTCEAIVVTPCFDMYGVCTEAAGGRVVPVAPRPGFSFPLDEVLDALTPATRMIFLTNPNNPTGLPVPRGAIRRLLAATAGRAVVFLDEAYVDFSGDTFLDEFRNHANVLVGRTFAKAYGLAGIRAGAVVARPETLAPLRRVVPPYSLNAFAAVALQAALDDPEYVRWYAGETERSKALLYGACERLGLPYWPSAANFVLVRIGARAGEVVAHLARRGIAIRDRSGEPGCAGCIRITTGVASHTEAAIAALEEALCGEA